jgi:hypothetical protein
MKNYTRLRRIVLLISASSFAWSVTPLSFGQAAPDAAAASPATPRPAEPERKIPVETVKQDEKLKTPVDDDILVLSPFETTTSNKGYYSTNTMSGTRLNSKIEDLGQSITVMTKEQMSDFGALDINDVFDLTRLPLLGHEGNARR